MPSPRLAARAVLIHESRLLLVNAWPGDMSDLWCAPGGGVERGASLPDNLQREVHEETGLRIQVGAPCLINEFHDPDRSFHQVEIFFRCTLTSGTLDAAWADPEGIVNKRRFVTREEMAQLRVKPGKLAEIAWPDPQTPTIGCAYDPLERIVT